MDGTAIPARENADAKTPRVLGFIIGREARESRNLCRFDVPRALTLPHSAPVDTAVRARAHGNRNFVRHLRETILTG